MINLLKSAKTNAKSTLGLKFIGQKYLQKKLFTVTIVTNTYAFLDSS